MMEPLPARPSPTSSSSSSSERMKQQRDDAAWSFRSLPLSMPGWLARSNRMGTRVRRDLYGSCQGRAAVYLYWFGPGLEDSGARAHNIGLSQFSGTLGISGPDLEGCPSACPSEPSPDHTFISSS